MNKIAGIILAAGKGKRMKSKDINKVVLSLGGRPMIQYGVKLLESFKISPIIVVVGFAKKSVMDILKGRVVYVEQKKRLGTAHAVLCALKYLHVALRSLRQFKNFSNASVPAACYRSPRDTPSEAGSSEKFSHAKAPRATDVIVLNGDDSAFYKKETIRNLIKIHRKNESSITFLTIEVDNPSGLGRIVRDDKGRLLGVIEDKDASFGHKKIKEINPGCYIFDLEFLKRYIRKIEKSSTTGEYYLTRLIDMAIKNKESVAALTGGRIKWRGINTMEELKEAERLFLQAK